MSRSISSDDDLKHWVMPEVRGNIVGRQEGSLRPQTVEDLEVLQKQAYEEGRQQGIEDGRAEMKAKAQHLDAILQLLDKPLLQLDKDIETQLAELALGVAGMLLKKESVTDARHIQGLIHEALDFLPIQSQHIKVRLNPADIGLLQESGVDVNAQDWTCVEDSGVSQGGCLVESDQSHIDASVETRIQQMVEQLYEQHAHPSYDDED